MHNLVNIRYATVNDAEAIAIVHTAAWQKIYRGHIPDQILDQLSVQERTQKWRAFLQGGTRILIIEKNGEIVGFASLCKVRDQDLDAKKCGEISAIYLKPNYWHQGLGTQLCHSALDTLYQTGFHAVIVWVLKENHQARRFYEKIGFRLTDAIKASEYTHNVILNEVRYKKILK